MPPATSSGSISLDGTGADDGQFELAMEAGEHSGEGGFERRRRHARLKQLFLGRVERPEAVPVTRRMGLQGHGAQHVAVVDPDAAIAVILPGESQPGGGQNFRPTGPVDRLGIQQDTVEIEENGLQGAHGRGNPIVACGIKGIDNHANRRRDESGN